MNIPRDELANLDVTLAKHIAPRIRAFAERTESYPPDTTLEQYRADLDEIAWALEAIATSLDSYAEPDYERVDAGLALFAKHYRYLWI
jgi:hypothetical protein